MKQSEVIARKLAEEKARIDNYVKYAASFQRVFNNKDGERVKERLNSMLEDFHPDPYMNAYFSGIRAIINLIERQSDDDEYQKYLKAIEDAKSKTQ